MKPAKSIIFFLPAVFLFSGCYTQFLMVDQTPSKADEVSFVVDSATGDTVRIIKQTDTVYTRDHQTCIWERDLMGYPRLRCYDSYYPSHWFYYNYSPWWYYDRYPYYSGGRYYGGRRHHHYHHGGTSGGSANPEPALPSGGSYNSRSRGVPDLKARGTSGGSSGSAATKKSSSGSGSTVTPGPAPSSQPSGERSPSVRDRSLGVPDAGARQQTPSEPRQSGSINQPTAQPSAPSSVSPPQQQQSAPPKQESEPHSRRRETRSW